MTSYWKHANPEQAKYNYLQLSHIKDNGHNVKILLTAIFLVFDLIGPSNIALTIWLKLD